ncbi:hypothetical protein BGZ49_002797 [Haplosporangium sp. Z 27]|nr:hypothetical protein BGZ49_002797 [Haplosporangium sp. Z 27]
MERVPSAALERHKEFVRVYHFSYIQLRSHLNIEPPLYTQLCDFTVSRALTSQITIKILKASKDIKRVVLGFINLAEILIPQIVLDGQEGAETISDCEARGQVVSPLDHLATTLQELSLEGMMLNNMELWRILQPVSKNIWSLSLKALVGALDDIPLDELTFPKVTHLEISFNNRLHYRIEEIIGRCPMLEYLELSGLTPEYPLDSLLHIIEGTVEIETRKQKEKRLKEGRILKRWVRPQLSRLVICGDFNVSPEYIANNSKLLAIIRACNGYQVYKKNKKDDTEEMDESDENDTDCNKVTKGIGYKAKSLRELDITLCILDDAARAAIESHKLTLEVLRITIQDRGARRSTLALERQGRVLSRLLRNCQRLRVFKFGDENVDADMSVILEGMLKSKSEDAKNNSEQEKDDELSGRESDSGFSEDDEQGTQQRVARSEAWLSPRLETLKIKKIGRWRPGSQKTDKIQERRFKFTTTTPNNIGENMDIEWILPEQNWDSYINDGSEALLGERWESSDLFNEDEDEKGQKDDEETLIERFLKLIAPSPRLKTLKLASFKLHRQ